ncbi:synaptotagmin-3-like [Cornus florida]|uniref:synaptotagmin-3-like n=1 Tax=Cornus florida TaxID=4283 RepID=UPI00289972DC|nr:synaptotagmin-3-like [Cornus florida]
MGLVSSLFGIIGFGIGILLGLFLGFLIFIYFEPRDVKDPIIRPLQEFDSSSLLDLLPEIPLWVKSPDYDRVNWLNRFIHDMWPYLDKAICSQIRSRTKPIFADYVGKFQIQSIDFESLTLGNLPPTINGIKVHESNEKELVFETTVRWAGNPNTILVLELLSLRISIQLIDLQIFATSRIILKPCVPTFPCFASIVVSLIDKPHVDFGLKVLGGDVMAIPGLYQFVQETIRKQVASLYLWPRTLEIPILDSSVGAVKKPVGILHVKVLRACRLLKMDLFGTSDPYVKLSLSGERLPAKKSSVKMNNLNPEWNEDFKLTVKDPESQVLEVKAYDWEKVGAHDKLGMQVVPLKLLTPHETKELTLDLLKNTNPNDPQNKKPRGQIMVEMTFVPFKEDSERFSGLIHRHVKNQSVRKVSEELSLSGAGLLMVTVVGAEDVEGKHHNNPYAFILFRGEKKKTKLIKKCRDPSWNEEFQFMLEEAPLKDKIHIEVMSKRRGFGFRSKEYSLGHVDINLIDVVHNGHINEKHHLINSRNGVIHVEMRWKKSIKW